MSEIRTICKRCGGSGEVPSTQPDPLNPGSYNPEMVTCSRCDGIGNFKSSFITGDLLDKLDDIMDKVNDIFEKVNE